MRGGSNRIERAAVMSFVYGHETFGSVMRQSKRGTGILGVRGSGVENDRGTLPVRGG